MTISEDAYDESRATGAGRPYDRSIDDVILTATIDLLAERDYERVTLDEVAARTGKAKTTLYRRWATKEDLVLAAIRSAGRPPEADRLPDLGSLRADLLAIVDSTWLGGTERRMSIFSGLSSANRSSVRVAGVVRSEVTEPYADIYRRLLLRAIDRGEVSSEFMTRVDVVAAVIPALSTHRLNASTEPVSRGFFVSVVDNVVLPSLGLTAA